jgi:hypothetical protein
MILELTWQVAKRIEILKGFVRKPEEREHFQNRLKLEGNIKVDIKNMIEKRGVYSLH